MTLALAKSPAPFERSLCSLDEVDSDARSGSEVTVNSEITVDSEAKVDSDIGFDSDVKVGLGSLSLDDGSQTSFTVKSKIESVESLPNIPKPKEIKLSPARRHTEYALISSSSSSGASVVAARAISKADRFGVARHSDSSGIRNKFEKVHFCTFRPSLHFPKYQSFK